MEFKLFLSNNNRFDFHESARTEEELSLYSWKRPFELSSSPSLYVDGTSRRDVIQGILGDCWLLSTCAAVAKREDLMQRVLDPKQVKTNILKAQLVLGYQIKN